LKPEEQEDRIQDPKLDILLKQAHDFDLELPDTPSGQPQVLIRRVILPSEEVIKRKTLSVGDYYKRREGLN